MSKIPPESVMFPGRGVSLKGNFYTVILNGKLVARRWPRRQPTPRNENEADKRRLLSLAARSTAYMSPRAQEFARDIAAQTKLLPRDLLVIALFNRLGYVVTKTGKKIYAMVAVQDVSQLLDAIGQTKGDVLVRGENWWEVIPIGDLAQVLTMGPDGLPIWDDLPAGAGGLEWQSAPFLQPQITTGSLGSQSYTGRIILVPAGTTINGVRAVITAFSGAHTGTPALYGANATTFSLTAQPLLRTGPAVSLALGVQSYPLSAPITPTLDTWMWGGLQFAGTGNVTLANVDQAKTGQFFTTSGTAAPNPSGTASSGTSQAVSWWFY